MNVTALEGFVKIVELSSFSAAADALFLSQSALSQQIRTLEGQLQFELFQHVPRKVVLTPAGQDFYPKAKQMVALYQEAVIHARTVKWHTNPPERHLLIGYSHDAMQMFGYDLFSLTNELCLAYTPILARCATRNELWRSLNKGERDLSFQLESSEIYANGLTFLPLCYVPEFCIPIHPPKDMPPEKLTLEQALEYRWLPTKQMYQTVYENALLQEGIRCGIAITMPGTIRSAPYGGPSLKMVPAVYYRRPNLSFMRILDWNKGHRFGIVVKKDADPVVMAYIRELRQVLPSLVHQLFGLEVEPILE